MSLGQEASWNWSPRWHLYGDSMVGILLRFAYANALSPQSLKGLISYTSVVSPLGRPLYCTGNIGEEWSRFCTAVGMPLHEAKNALLGDILEILRGTPVVAQRLRFCSECLKVGYHARYFQILALQECPIHHRPLRDTCPSCGSVTPFFRVCRELMSQVYCCWKCNALYASSSVSIQTYFNPGLETDRLREIWQPIDQWLSAFREVDLNFASLREWVIEYAGEYRAEREVDAVYVLNAIRPLPAGPFVWQTPSLPRKCLYFAEGGALPKRPRATEGYVAAAYSEAKKGIERRLTPDRLAILLQQCRELGWSCVKPDTGMSAAELAYVLWRVQFESLSTPELMGRTGEREDVFIGQDLIPFALGNLKPAGWKIFFWAAYRGLVFDVERAILKGDYVADLARGGALRQFCVLSSTSLRATGRGVIAYPVPKF